MGYNKCRPYVRACQILMEQSNENVEIGRIFCRTGSIYLLLQTLWPPQTEKNDYISFFHNDIEYTNFEFISIYFHFHFSIGS